MTFSDSKQRFSNRVADYVRYRPGYPTGVRDLLRRRVRPQIQPRRRRYRFRHRTSSANSSSKIGNRVFGVEPNDEMRTAGEEYAGHSYDVHQRQRLRRIHHARRPMPSISSLRARPFTGSSNLQLAPNSIASSKPAGWVIIVWNERLLDDTPFLRDYEELLLANSAPTTPSVKESYPRAAQMLRFFQRESLQHRTNSPIFRSSISTA